MAISNQTVARISIQAEVSNASAQIQKLATKVAKLERSLDASQRQAKNFKNQIDGAGRAAKLGAMAMGAAGLAGAAVGAYHALNQLAEQSMKLDTAQRNLKFSISQARASTMGMVSDAELMTRANQAAALGVANTSEQFADLSEMAVKLGQNLGMSTEQAYESLIGSLGRGSSAMLDNLGVSLKAEEAQRIYAMRIGKTVSELSESERKIAFQTIAYERLSEATNQVEMDTDNAAAGWQRLKTSIDNLIADAYQIPQMFDEWGKTIEGLFMDLIGDESPQAVDNLWLSVEQFTDMAMASFRLLVLDVEGFVAAMGSADKMVRRIANEAVRQGMATDEYKAKQRAEGLMALGESLGSQYYRQAEGAAAFGASLMDGGEKTKPKGRGGRGGKRGAIASQGGGVGAVDLREGRMAQNAALAEQEAMAIERTLELEQAKIAMAESMATNDDQRHLLRIMALEQEAMAEEKIFAARIQAAEYAGDQSEVVSLRHEAEMMRLENQAAKEQEIAAIKAKHAADEKARLDRSRKQFEAWGATTVSVMGDMSESYSAVAQMAGVGEEKRQRVAMKMGGIILLTEAAIAAGKAAVAYATGNIPQGVALTAASVTAGIKGAQLLAGRVPNAGGGGMGGGGGGQGGAMGTTFAANNRTVGSANAPGSRVPGSPTAADSRPRPSSSRQGGQGGNTIIVNYAPGVQVGNADQEAAEQVFALAQRGAKGAFLA